MWWRNARSSTTSSASLRKKTESEKHYIVIRSICNRSDDYAILDADKTRFAVQGNQVGETEEGRPPGVRLSTLEAHRKRQDEFRHKYGSDYRTDLDLIFAKPDGTPLKPDSISAAVSLLRRHLKLPKGASLHTLRHTHGSFLLASGMDLATVSEGLGHSSVRVAADVYSHAMRGRDQEAARKWDDFMRPHGVSTIEADKIA